MTKDIEELIATIYSQLGLTELIASKFLEELLECSILFNQKQHDYGSGNIGKFGYDGVVVRLSDKLERIINLQKRGGKDIAVADEAIEDTLRDIANYALIAIMCRKGVWPSNK